MPDRIRYKMILQYENGRYSDWSEEVIISPDSIGIDRSTGHYGDGNQDPDA